MTDRTESLWYSLHRGSATSGIPIIASMCNDEGVCIMCDACGHIFVNSKPLSDQSEPADSGELAKALYYHRCDMGRREQRGSDNRAHRR